MQIKVREMPLAKVRIFASLCPNVRERSVRLVRGTPTRHRGVLIAATARRATCFTSVIIIATTLLLFLFLSRRRRYSSLAPSPLFALLAEPFVLLLTPLFVTSVPAFLPQPFSRGAPGVCVLFPPLSVSFLPLSRSLEEQEEHEEEEQLFLAAVVFLLLLLSSSSYLDYFVATRTRSRRFQIQS